MEKELDELFNVIYDKIYNSCKEMLEEAKKSNVKYILNIGLILLILNFVIFFHPQFKSAISLTMCLSVVILTLLAIIGKANYRNLYKRYIIENIIKGYNSKYYYDEKLGIMKKEYLISNFDRDFEQFHSEDRIYGKLESGENFQMSEIVTYKVKETRDSKGNKHISKTQTYRGLYGIVRLKKNIVSQIHVKSNSNFRKYNEDKLQMESIEFEKYYDCLSMDKISTMRVFTPELIEKYNELARVYSDVIEIKIEDDKIFFRFKTNELFEPPMFSSGLNKELLKSYFRRIYYPIELIKVTIENINSVYE